MIVFTWITYTLTHSASLSAAVFAANQLPTVVFQPLVAPIVDKMQKQKIMVLADALRAIVLAGFILLFVCKALTPWMFIVFSFGMNSIEAFRVPAGVAYMPHVLDATTLERGINLNQLTSSSCILLGTAVGGVLVSIFPLFAMLLDLCSFVISAILIQWMKVHEIIDKKSQENTYWRNLKGGVQYLSKNTVFLIFICIALLSNTLNAVYISVSAAYISGILHKPAIYLSIAEIIVTVCSLLMMVVYPTISKKLKASTIFSWIIFGSTAIFYGILSFLPMSDTRFMFLIWIVVFIILGIGSGIFGAYINVMFVKVVAPAYLSRASGFFNSSVSIVMPVVSIVIAIGVNVVSIPVIFGVTSFICLVCMLFFGFHSYCKSLDIRVEPTSRAQGDGDDTWQEQ